MTDENTLDILLIEDNPGDARLVEELFKEQSLEGAPTLLDRGPMMKTTHASTLTDGLRFLDQLELDAILLDLQLPDCNGLDTIEAVTSARQDLPIIVLTGLPEQQLGIDAVSLGAQDYLVKDDLSPETLVMTVRYAIERKQVERQLRDQSVQLELLNRLTQHDIKNDISLIIGRSQELTEHIDARGKPILEEIIRSGNHTLQLTRSIGDALDAVVNNGDEQLEPVELSSVLIDEVEKARNLYPGVDIRLSNVPTVSVRANRLLPSIFGNLISNGALFNDKDDPVVAIDVDTRDEIVRVTVADNGPGIPHIQRESIFESGVQNEESSGLGIGLMLVNRLVDQFNGEIRIEDNNPVGSNFVVDLPRYSASQ